MARAPRDLIEEVDFMVRDQGRRTQRHRLLGVAASAVLLASMLAGGARAESPNIVLILADDLGFSDTAPYGSEIETPSISALAAQGVTFTSHLNGVPNIPESIPPVQAEHPN